MWPHSHSTGDEGLFVKTEAVESIREAIFDFQEANTFLEGLVTDVSAREKLSK